MCEPGYLAWCQAQGVVVHGVAPALVADGAWRGIVATQPLTAGTAVVEVPEALLLSVLSAARDPQLAAALQQHQQHQQSKLSSHQALALHLLHEASKGAASPWQPYIRQLPQHYTNLAAWPAAAVAALQLPCAQEAAAAARDKARSEWRAARPVLHALGVASKWASWPAWLWASCALLSRTMFHPGDPECGCLTPLGDLHNYAPPPPPFTPHLARDSARLLLAQQQQQQCPGSQPAAQPALADEPQPSPSEEAAPSSSSSSGSSQPGTVAADGALTPPASPASVPGELVASAPLPPPPRRSNDNPDASDAQHQQDGDALLLLAAADQQEEQQQEGPDGAAASCAGAVCGDGHFDAERCVYRIVARRSYAPGEQVFLCYGRHTNLELLELYGFLLPAAAAAAAGEAAAAVGAGCNPHDAALLPPELLQQQLQAALEAQLARQQQQRQQPAWQQQHACQGAAGRRGGAAAPHAWRAVELQLPPADAFVHACGQPSWQLLSALRLAAAPTRSQGYRAHEGEPISLDSELLVLTALGGACRAQLAALPTTRQQDAALLAQLRAGAQCCAETGAAVATGGGQGAGSTSVALNKCQEQQQDEKQQQDDKQARLASECLLLAVEWRQTYKACLSACVAHCEAALALVARHAPLV